MRPNAMKSCGSYAGLMGCAVRIAVQPRQTNEDMMSDQHTDSAMSAKTADGNSMSGLPPNVTAFVRTAKNRALCYLPAPYAGKGRRRVYGDKAPAPQDYNKLRTGWQMAQLTMRGMARRTVYRVDGPFLRGTMPTLPLFPSVVRGLPN